MSIGIVTRSFAAPTNITASGIAWDGRSLWVVGFDSERIYQIDPVTGTEIRSFATPAASAQGIAWDGNTLWHTSSSTDLIYQIDPATGTVIKSFSSPGSSPAGLAWDGHTLWNVDFGTDLIYQIDPITGTVIKSFSAPGSTCFSLCFVGANQMWIVDDNDNVVYLVDTTTGTTLNSFPSPSTSPYGIVWDGVALWHTDFGNNTIYRINISAASVGGQPMSVVRIAASDAQPSEKAIAHLFCPATDVSAVFTAAFALLPADGGVIELSTGTFLFNSALDYPNKAATIVGQTYIGPDKTVLPTVLQFTLGGVDDCVTFWASNIPQALKNVAIMGDDTNTRYGVFVPGSSSFNQLEHVIVFDVTNEAFLTDTGSSQCVFTRCASRNNDEGFKTLGVTHKFYACSATRDSDTGVGGTHGFRDQGISCTYDGCVSERHGIGFHASGFSEGANFFGCYTEQCTISFIADGNPDPINSLFSGCRSVAAQHATTGAILADAAVHPIFIGCYVKQSVSNISLQLGTNCLCAVAKGCALQDTTQLNAVGAATYRIEDCIDENDAWFDASA